MKKIIVINMVGLFVALQCFNLFAQPTPPGSGGCTNCPPPANSFVPQPYVPGLKLFIPPISGTNLPIHLLEADPAGAYDIYFATDLVSSTWSDILQGTNGQTNFSLAWPQFDSGFFRAARSDTSMDDAEFMTVYFPNLVVTTNWATGLVGGGPAASMAILVNDTNFSDAHWIPFSSVPLVQLGATDEVYNVWFGFTGSDGTNYWIMASVTLDTSPPTLVITNPTSSIVSQPMIQVQGYANESLSSLTFDVSNAAGIWTNQMGYITSQFYDTNLFAFTTDYFQCYDIALTNGVNSITLHAVDSANGLEATTNFNYTLDYSGDTTPPVLTLIWPQDGAEISGGNFTVQAQVDDATAKIAATIVDSSNNTNVVQGLVERDGTVWIQNVPLATGTNTLTITAADAAGNTSTNNLTLYQSSVTVIMTPLTSDQLNQSSVTVYGTVSDATVAVYVNGVQATVNEDGTWEADNVPVSSSGTAIFDLEVYSDVQDNIRMKFNGVRSNDSSDDSAISSKVFALPQPVTVGLESYTENMHHNWALPSNCFGSIPRYGYRSEIAGWEYETGGFWHLHEEGTRDGDEGGITDSTEVYPPGEEGEDELDLDWEYANTPYSWIYNNDCESESESGYVNISTRLVIRPRDQVSPAQEKLYLIQASASEALEPTEEIPWAETPLPPEWLNINNQALINSGMTNESDGSVWGKTIISVPAGVSADVTPVATQLYDYNDYTFNVQANEINLQLGVDANRDGNITFDDADQTGANNPYRFWLNNDYDGYDSSIDDYDDLDPSTGDDANNTTINCTRDLEDYTRLWINTQGITTELQNGTFLLALEWKNVSGNPGIRIFPSVETNGGSLYVTDTNTAQEQITAPYSDCIIDSYVGQSEISSSLPFFIPTNFWSNISTSQPMAHLLFDAVSRGSGQLVLSIYKNDESTKLAESQPLYLKLQDVKELYERYTVGDDPSSSPATTASLVTSPYSYDSTISADDNYILFVHGWNLATWEKDAFAETAFKRLYWQGYEGHFGEFRWPTGYGFSGIISAITDADNYDNSEFNAWYSGTGLKNLLTTLNSEYPGQVYLMAHSMGNVVAGEALKQAGSSQLVNTYVAMQGAVPTHCYDASATIRTNYPNGDFNNRLDIGYLTHSPNYYAGYYTNGAPSYFDGTTGAGSCINFYNSQDWALSYWAVDQDLKPDIQSGFSYNSSNNKFYAGGSEIDFPSATYEIFAYCDTAYCFALGAQPDVNGAFERDGSPQQMDLQATFEFEDQHKDHSGEFNSDNMSRASFWDTILVKMQLKEE